MKLLLALIGCASSCFAIADNCDGISESFEIHYQIDIVKGETVYLKSKFDSAIVHKLLVGESVSEVKDKHVSLIYILSGIEEARAEISYVQTNDMRSFGGSIKKCTGKFWVNEKNA